MSDPQVRWAQPVLDRLELRGDERVLDAGCGTGRVTEQLLERLPRGAVVALDADPEMVAAARKRLGRSRRVQFVVANLLEPLPVDPVDAVFSTAAFHWVKNHDRLFRNIAGVLKPGGQLVAQFGAEGNVASFLRVMDELGELESSPWLFPSVEETEGRLRCAGFVELRVWMYPEPTRFETLEDMAAFIRTSCLGPWLARKPPREHEAFVAEIASRLPSLELDYVRLNVVARKA